MVRPSDLKLIKARQAQFEAADSRRLSLEAEIRALTASLVRFNSQLTDAEERKREAEGRVQRVSSSKAVALPESAKASPHIRRLVKSAF